MNEARNQQILNDYRAGTTYAAIGRKYNISGTTATYIVQKAIERETRRTKYAWLHPDCPDYVYRRLEAEGIDSREKLEQHTAAQLFRIPSFGRKCMWWLEQSGITLIEPVIVEKGPRYYAGAEAETLQRLYYFLQGNLTNMPAEKLINKILQARLLIIGRLRNFGFNTNGDDLP